MRKKVEESIAEVLKSPKGFRITNRGYGENMSSLDTYFAEKHFQRLSEAEQTAVRLRYGNDLVEWWSVLRKTKNHV